ncbi:hypothetical protein SeMB42_g06778 [Synchytrium endobioticum]|uniref:Cullin-5 n=1 Tax=Synchytrium endobioticum TaxID=286115 RepID=A0A507C8N7_9FUNG|nr:hypothetical protein SeMB42_g06778 [Synchytrium endobioticum]TPX50970.1 hypothetical protein SeLEV6574_g00573 [Synchytrium endobioticum]
MSLRPKKIDFQAVFADFCKELSNMYSFNNVHVSGIDMFQMVYDMCTAAPRSHTEVLFEGISGFLRDHTTSELQKIVQHDDIVAAYATEWEKYSTASRFTNIICEYLNKMSMNAARSSSAKRKRPSIEALAFAIWKDLVVYQIRKCISNRLIRQIVSLIKSDRDGAVVHYEAARKSIDSLVYLGRDTEFPLRIYMEEFETLYLAETRAYYEAESIKLISGNSISAYMHKAHQRLQDEMLRNQRYCDPTSHAKIIQVVEQQYIAAHQQRIHAQFESMVENERAIDCSMAYSLLSRIPNGVDPLLLIFENYIASLGKSMVARLGAAVAKDPREYVESLMDLQTKYVTFANDVFRADAAFVAAVDKAFRTIINDMTANPNARGPEVLAKYCDSILRKNAKTNLTENDLEDRIARVMTLFKYVEDKDVFQKFYSKLLARRLIFETSVSEDAEASVISKLKTVCGVEYTSKLQRMFTDLSLSNDLNAAFKSFVEDNGIFLTVDCNVIVLTAGSWPVSASHIPISLPQELEKSVSTFTSFYNHHHNGRKLTWLHQLARADVRVIGFDKRYELCVSLPQVSILMMMNADKRPTWKDMKEALKMNDTELAKHVKPILDVKLLTSSTPDLEDASVVSIFSGFASKRTKIKLSTLFQVESQQESDATRRAIDEDRAIYLQAAIVRIMKSRKRLAHQRLIQEVLAQVSPRFAPPVAAIKKAIEALLEKGYIERPASQKAHYDYVA